MRHDGGLFYKYMNYDNTYLIIKPLLVNLCVIIFYSKLIHLHVESYWTEILPAGTSLLLSYAKAPSRSTHIPLTTSCATPADVSICK